MFVIDINDFDINIGGMIIKFVDGMKFDSAQQY